MRKRKLGLFLVWVALLASLGSPTTASAHGPIHGRDGGLSGFRERRSFITREQPEPSGITRPKVLGQDRQDG
jgi:hypothetical protein